MQKDLSMNQFILVDKNLFDQVSNAKYTGKKPTNQPINQTNKNAHGKWLKTWTRLYIYVEL